MTLEDALRTGKFIVTCELAPPKGTDVSSLIKLANSIKDLTDAVNLTDGQGGNMRMCSLAASIFLLRDGIDVIWQVTCRDRNRIALQADCLGAFAVGVRNILLMRGDDPANGDHPDAKAVFDLDTTELIKAVKNLNSGFDMSGKELKGRTNFLIGCTAHPNPPDLVKQKDLLDIRFDLGASFIQTQLCYEVDQIKRFIDSLGNLASKTIVGITPLKSLEMAVFMNKKISGISVPEDILKRLEEIQDKQKEGLLIAREIISAIRNYDVGGVHLMAIGQENKLPDIIQFLLKTN